MQRPYFFAGIEQLEALAANPNSSPDCISAVARELSFRKSFRARQLASELPLGDNLESLNAARPKADSEAPTSTLGVKLSTLNLSTRARNVLEAKNITFASELCRLTELELLQSKNAGRKTVTELRTVLNALGLHFGMKPSEAGPTPPVHMSLPTVLRLQEPNDLIGALKAHVGATTASERNSNWVIEHFGWDGRPRRTLESVGSASNVTRERVRQVAAKCVQRLRNREVAPRALDRALALLKNNVPLRQAALDELLRQHHLATNGFDIGGIKTAATAFGLEFPYSIIDDEDPLIIQKQFAKLPGELLKAAKSEASAHGAVTGDHLVGLCRESLGCSVERSFVSAILRADRTFAPLNNCEGWWWRPELAAGGRNRLVNTVRKVLAACPSIRIAELREACRRHVRSNHIAPPTPVLRSICSALPFLKVRDDRVERASAHFDWDDVLNPSEKLLLQIFEDRGLVLDSYSVSEAGIGLGLNENSLTIYKTYSPILWRPVFGYFAVVGSDIPIGHIDELQRQRQLPSRTNLEFGWTADHQILVARHLTKGVWLSGITSLPAAVQKVAKGEFSLVALGKHNLGTVTVREETCSA